MVFSRIKRSNFFSDLWHDILKPLLLHERDDQCLSVAAPGWNNYLQKYKNAAK